MQTMSEEKTASEGHAEGEAGTRSAELVKRARRQHGIEAVRTIIRFAMDRMRETQLQEVASSMTLTTLLSLVPLIAVAMSAFALFPSFADSRHALEEAIISGVLPQQYTETIVTYLRNFTDHASGLGIFGLAGLAVTALLLIDKFFVTVNRIYQVRRMRSWGQRALLYWALITLGPLVIAFSLTVSTQAIRSASEGVDATSVEWGMAVLQFAIQVASYTFLYKFVPNCHVQLSHAAVGGVSASLAGLAVREAFGHYVSAGTLTSIYGAFVAFPVLLLWFYVSWLIVFGGAAITATIPLLTSGRFADSYKRGNDFLTGVALLKTLWRHRREGETSVGITTLADEVDSYPQAARRILLRLAEKGYCVEIMSEKPKSHSDWALLCDPAAKSLRDACTALLVDGTNHLTSPKRASSSRDEGMLFDWYRGFTSAEMLAKPLDEVFTIDEEPQDVQAEQAARPA